MKSRKAQCFSLLEIMVSLAILVLVSALLGVKVTSLISEHKFNNSVQSLVDDVKQLQILSVSYGTDCAVKLYKRKGTFYYVCTSEASIPRGPLFSSHLLHGVKAVSINGKKSDSLKFTLFSTGRVDPAISLGLHREEIDSHGSLWIDTRKQSLITLSHKLPSRQTASVIPQMPETKNLLVDK
jgi:hypothetical protein